MTEDVHLATPTGVNEEAIAYVIDWLKPDTYLPRDTAAALAEHDGKREKGKGHA